MVARRNRCRGAWLFLFAIVAFANPGVCGGLNAAEPLHARIDALATTGQVNPIAGLANDAEFLRRVSLDLLGAVPTAAEARVFIDDASPLKRTALVDKYLADPRHARHLALSFDVMLMERRPEKNVPAAEWQAYLYNSFLVDKPLDQLAREILSVDGVDPSQRSPARFFLDRDAEPNLLTRDVGRVFFGRDLQCAQCHDHPLIADYHQSEYYGLLAFFSRTELFTAPDKKVVLAEKAEGEVSYQSVFDPSAKGITRPRVPGGKQIEEPKLKPGEEYTVAPAKDVRHVPKFSRRGQLAVEVTGNRQFARNFANRIWAMLLGRGLVDAVDLHHGDNPAVQPQLLELLTDELIAAKFSAKALIREIVLSQTYQRSIDAPADLRSVAANAAAQVPSLTAERDRLAQVAAASTAAVEQAEADLASAREAVTPFRDELAKVSAPLAALRKSADDTAKALAAAQAQLVSAQSAQQSLTEAAAKAKEAADKLPAEKDLAEAAVKFKARADQFPPEIEKLTKAVADLNPPSVAASAALAVAMPPVDALSAKLEEVQAKVAAAEPIYDAARAHANQDLALLKLAERRIASAQSIIETAKANPADLAFAKATTELIEKSSREFSIGSLRQLSPEQLAWSMMQATGVLQAQLAASTTEVAQAVAARNMPADATAQQRLLEQTVFGKLQPQAQSFVGLFAAGAGQPQQDFFATVDQALFFANGDLLKSWLTPAGDNLVARLVKIDDPKALSEELYLSVLTRRPTDAEVAAVATYLATRADKPAATSELAWSLLTSSEFRFNH
jgi:hypothetical protein